MNAQHDKKNVRTVLSVNNSTPREGTAVRSGTVAGLAARASGREDDAEGLLGVETAASCGPSSSEAPQSGCSVGLIARLPALLDLDNLVGGLLCWAFRSVSTEPARLLAGATWSSCVSLPQPWPVRGQGEVAQPPQEQYKRGPNSVLKNHSSFRCEKQTQKLAPCACLS